MLTKRQKEILDYINNYIKENSYSPTLEEIAKHFKLSSVATVHEHLETLKSKGYLKKSPNQPRAVEIGPGENLIEVPLVGTIAAGKPIEALEEKETITIARENLGRKGNLYTLKVKGDSMINEGIFDGDIVIVRKQNNAENGETVVAIIDNNEATLKKLYREKNQFRLQPANPDIKPIFTKELIIQGKVISIIRNFIKLEDKIEKKEEFTEATTEYMKKADLKYRKSLGQYFTPRSVRETLIYKLPNTTQNPKVLDPGCGTGEFLITAKEYFKNPKIYGWDIDKKLINIAKKIVPNADIKYTDALLNRDYNKYDFVIGNPPYYEFTPTDAIKKKFEGIINGRVNIFSLFVYQGINWLKEGGHLAYVVPPSMNNGAYFLNLRKFIVDHTNIEYLHIFDDPRMFHGALQSIMLLILKKGKNKGDYLFKKNGILIFSEDTKYLNKAFENKITLYDLGYQVRTGRLVWNQNKPFLTNNPNSNIPLIWAHNITPEGLKFPIISNKKPQYVKKNDFDVGPAIVVNRITGSVKTAKLRAALIPPGMKFIAENHVNVIFPPFKQKQIKLNLGANLPKINLTLQGIARQLSSKEKLKVMRNITGNTQVSKTELEKLFPIDIN